MLDIISSVLIILVLLPFWSILILTEVIIYSGKIFFIQKRIGFKSEIFRLLKFKTMNDNRDSTGRLLPDSERLTKTGRFLRAFSLDELPQLINVLKGDMSLVGPRPLLPEYLPLYNERQARRHEVRPA